MYTYSNSGKEKSDIKGQTNGGVTSVSLATTNSS